MAEIELASDFLIDLDAGDLTPNTRAKTPEVPSKKGPKWEVKGGDLVHDAHQYTHLRDRVLPRSIKLFGEKPLKKRKLKPVEAVKLSQHLETQVSFGDLYLSRALCRGVQDLGYDFVTPVQRDTIPKALEGKDLLVISETGSGKTAAFLLPILERLGQSASVKSRKRVVNARGVSEVVVGRQSATKALILLPTRELAAQCYSMLETIARYSLVTYSVVTGGFAKHTQSSSLRNQPDIIVATPGRMLDHLLNAQNVHMDLLEIVVLDEADRLLQLGFQKEILSILELCAKGDRQTMLFSATLEDTTQNLVDLALRDPQVLRLSGRLNTAQTLKQEFVPFISEVEEAAEQEGKLLENKLKFRTCPKREALLLYLCHNFFPNNVLIFCRTKKACHRLAILFNFMRWSCSEIHGNLSQEERYEAIKAFQSGKVDFLIATDVAGRGIDLPNLDTVINFELPLRADSYVHRCGRTARQGRAGLALTLYDSEKEYPKVKQLMKASGSNLISKRNVDKKDILKYWKKIKEAEGDIREILMEEQIDRQYRIGRAVDKVLSQKGANISELFPDPESTWKQSKKDKWAENQEMTSKANRRALQDHYEEIDDEVPRKKRKAFTSW